MNDEDIKLGEIYQVLMTEEEARTINGKYACKGIVRAVRFPITGRRQSNCVYVEGYFEGIPDFQYNYFVTSRSIYPPTELAKKEFLLKQIK